MSLTRAGIGRPLISQNQSYWLPPSSDGGPYRAKRAAITSRVSGAWVEGAVVLPNAWIVPPIQARPSPGGAGKVEGKVLDTALELGPGAGDTDVIGAGQVVDGDKPLIIVSGRMVARSGQVANLINGRAQRHIKDCKWRRVLGAGLAAGDQTSREDGGCEDK